MIPLTHRLRFRYAFTHERREAIKTAAATIAGLLLILLAYGIVGRMDYEEGLRQEAEAALERASLQQAALLACLNSGAPGLYTIDDKGTRHYIVCGQPYTVSDENTRHTRRTM